MELTQEQFEILNSKKGIYALLQNQNLDADKALKLIKYESRIEKLQEELINFSKKIVNDLDDKDVVDFISLKGDEILKQFDLPELVSSSLEYILEKEKHDEILESIIINSEINTTPTLLDVLDLEDDNLEKGEEE